MSVAWGILSTARINRRILDAAGKSPHAEIAAVASRDAARAEPYAREHAIPKSHGSYEALLEDPEVEAVYISVPNSLHVDLSVRALEAGKHVLCEKPLTRRASEAERAFDAAERAGRLLMEGFMYRHHPQTRRLVELVEEGAVGRLELIRAAFSFTIEGSTNIRLLDELDGGALMDVGCYCVNASRLLAGEPERASGQQIVGPGGVDVRFAGTMRFPGDVLAEFHCGLDLPFRDELEVVGSEGSLFLDDPWHCRSPRIELVRGEKRERIDVEEADSYQLELENMAAAMRGETEPLLGRADGVGQARTLEQLYLSAA